MSEHDPFEPATLGYDPDSFYTAHGDRSTESLESKIKFDPVIWDQVHSLFVLNDKFGDYRNMSDFVADAVHHRLRYLLTEFEYKLETTPEMLRQIDAWESRANSKRVNTRLASRKDAVDKIVTGIERTSSDQEGWSDPEALEQFLKEGKQLAPSVQNDGLKSMLLRAVRGGELRLGEMKTAGQRALAAAMEEIEEMQVWTGDPFDVAE